MLRQKPTIPQSTLVKTKSEKALPGKKTTSTNLTDYKGQFYEKPAETFLSPRTGAHFKFKDMCRLLKPLIKTNPGKLQLVKRRSSPTYKSAFQSTKDATKPAYDKTDEVKPVASVVYTQEDEPDTPAIRAQLAALSDHTFNNALATIRNRLRGQKKENDDQTASATTQQKAMERVQKDIKISGLLASRNPKHGL